MSYKEYIDLFKKAQIDGQYHMFVYDIINSRKNLTTEERGKIVKLIFEVYKRIEEIEEKEHRSILHKSKNLIQGKIKKQKTENGEIYEFDYTYLIKDKRLRADLLEPFYLVGDLYGFTIQRGTLNQEQVDYIFEKERKKLGIKHRFHKANGYYETDKYEEANTKYFRGYCIQQLEKLSKKQNNKQEKNKQEEER